MSFEARIQRFRTKSRFARAWSRFTLKFSNFNVGILEKKCDFFQNLRHVVAACALTQAEHVNFSKVTMLYVAGAARLLFAAPGHVNLFTMPYLMTNSVK